MKKVLIITYFFPPDLNIGVMRPQALAKYLPKYGWEPIILTKNTNILNNDYDYKIITTPKYSYNSIDALLQKFGFNSQDKIKSFVGVDSSKSKNNWQTKILINLSEPLTCPDQYHIWYKDAVEVASKAIEELEIDAIISTSFPVTSHIIAKKLKLKYGLFWIADLRDLWTQNHYYPYSFLRHKIDKIIELRTLSKADVLTTVSTPLAKKIQELHKNKDVFSIMNGFDPDLITPTFTNFNKKLTITYTGSLYRGKRDPSLLFEAITNLITDGIINPNKIQVLFYGQKEEWLEKEIHRYRLKNVVFQCGFISKEASLNKQKESDILLLLMWNHPEESGVYTGKIFEYLAAHRPILVMGSNNGGVVKDLIEETMVGVYTSSIIEIKNYIVKSYEEHNLNGIVDYKANKLKVDLYSQYTMAEKFAKILKKSNRKGDI